MSFIFGGNTGMTPEDAQRKRDIANALAIRALRQPKDIGEGLNAIGQALMFRKMSGDASRIDQAGLDRVGGNFDRMMANLMGGGGGQGAPDMGGGAPANPVRDALVPPIERAPGPQYTPPGDAGAYGVTPPDGGPALGTLVDDAPMPNQANPPAGHPLHVAQAGGQTPPPAQQQYGQPLPMPPRQQAQPQPQAQQQVQAQAQPQGGQQQANMKQIWSVMSDPYATPAQKSVATMLFKQKFEQMDPRYQLEVRKLAQDVQNGSVEAQVALRAKFNEMDEQAKIRAEDRAEGRTISAEERAANTPRERVGVQIDEQRLAEMQNKPPEVRTIEQADGSQVAVQWDAEGNRWLPINAPQGGGSVREKGKLTESEQKLTLFQSLQTETQPVLLDLEKDFNPGNLPDAFAGGVIGGNFYKSEKGQIYESAQTAWAEGALRIATGAAAQAPEMERTKRAYFAQPGDTPTTIQFKAQMREMYQRAIQRGLGFKDVEGSLPLPSEFAKSVKDQLAAQGRQQGPSTGKADLEQAVPQGVDPEDWKFMDPEARKLWQ